LAIPRVRNMPGVLTKTCNGPLLYFGAVSPGKTVRLLSPARKRSPSEHTNITRKQLSDNSLNNGQTTDHLRLPGTMSPQPSVAKKKKQSIFNNQVPFCKPEKRVILISRFREFSKPESCRWE